jgi:hypothetical protein
MPTLVLLPVIHLLVHVSIAVKMEVLCNKLHTWLHGAHAGPAALRVPPPGWALLLRHHEAACGRQEGGARDLVQLLMRALCAARAWQATLGPPCTASHTWFTQSVYKQHFNSRPYPMQALVFADDSEMVASELQQLPGPAAC